MIVYIQQNQLHKNNKNKPSSLYKRNPLECIHKSRTVISTISYKNNGEDLQKKQSFLSLVRIEMKHSFTCLLPNTLICIKILFNTKASAKPQHFLKQDFSTSVVFLRQNANASTHMLYFVNRRIEQIEQKRTRDVQVN